LTEVASISIESIIKKLSSYDKKIIIALYHYKELGFNKLSRLIGAGSPSNISNRLKILISEELVKKEKDIYKLTELGEKVAIELLIEQEIDEKKYFKKKLIPLIYSIKMNYFSFPLKIEWKYKYRIDDALKYYITLLYIKSLRNKISDSSKESIKFIKNAWKTIENPEDNYGNIPFSWNSSIKEILEEIEKDIKEKEEEKEFLILLKEQIENENINKKIFKEFHEYSKNKILWYINKFLKLKKLAKMAIGAIIGIISMLVLFLIILLALPFLIQ
jgi:DNA-binding HxlR family transcriptional regulator